MQERCTGKDYLHSGHNWVTPRSAISVLHFSPNIHSSVKAEKKRRTWIVSILREEWDLGYLKYTADLNNQPPALVCMHQCMVLKVCHFTGRTSFLRTYYHTENKGWSIVLSYQSLATLTLRNSNNNLTIFYRAHLFIFPDTSVSFMKHSMFRGMSVLLELISFFSFSHSWYRRRRARTFDFGSSLYFVFISAQK